MMLSVIEDYIDCINAHESDSDRDSSCSKYWLTVRR
jgi:hypothetical protein